MLEKVLITLAIVGAVLVYNRFLAGRTFTFQVELLITREMLVALAFGVFAVLMVSLLLVQGGGL
jgi:hypothetical protein